jgi:orotidine-5'-phosphate decarboxylase
MTAAFDAASAVPSASAANTANFADRLHAAIARCGTPACVGLDPVLEKLPPSLRRRSGPGGGAGIVGAADQFEAFCLGVIDAVADIVPAIKPQSACFERYAQSGLGVLRKVIQHAHSRGLIVILDAKRGDIGATAEHYAVAAFGTSQTNPNHAADALTVNGYMGADTIEPFLTHGGSDAAGRNGVFVLVRTSNPGSDAVQSQKLADGRTVAEMLADQVAELGRQPGRIGACGLSSVGAVVGATKSSEAAALRARLSEQYLLIPGYGAQGGTLEDLKPMLRSTASPADAGILVNASRSVIYAAQPDQADWASAVRQAAKQFAGEIASLF